MHAAVRRGRDGGRATRGVGRPPRRLVRCAPDYGAARPGAACRRGRLGDPPRRGIRPGRGVPAGGGRKKKGVGTLVDRPPRRCGWVGDVGEARRTPNPASQLPHPQARLDSHHVASPLCLSVVRRRSHKHTSPPPLCTSLPIRTQDEGGHCLHHVHRRQTYSTRTAWRHRGVGAPRARRTAPRRPPLPRLRQRRCGGGGVSHDPSR